MNTLQHHCLTEHRVFYRAYKITSLSSLHSQLCENIRVSTLANDILCSGGLVLGLMYVWLCVSGWRRDYGISLSDIMNAHNRCDEFQPFPFSLFIMERKPDNSPSPAPTTHPAHKHRDSFAHTHTYSFIMLIRSSPLALGG